MCKDLNVMNESQLKTYYEKLQSEYTYSLKKKDTLVNWSLMALLAFMSVYFNIIRMDKINDNCENIIYNRLIILIIEC